MDTTLIKAICSRFGVNNEIVSIEPITDGLVNTTLKVDFDDSSSYLVQKINTQAFKKPAELMENISRVTTYLREVIRKNGGNPDRETLTFLSAENGDYFVYDDNGGCWRIYRFIGDAFTYNTIESASVFEDAGSAFGKFLNLLDGYPMDSLHETIVNFHNTRIRVENLEASIKNNLSGRAGNVNAEIAFALDRKAEASRLVDMLEKGELPLRVTHNDTKLNNVLFDTKTGKAFCVIDLDTIMPGLSLYDFGDSLRFGSNTAAEDEADLSKVSVDLELFEAFARGYLSSAAFTLTQSEIDNLAFSAKLMTYECGVRFLTDYIDGDIYFKTKYAEHNLVRARNQFALVADMEKHMDEMNAIIQKLCAELSAK